MSSYVFPSYLTAPQFDEPDEWLRSWMIEIEHTTDPDRQDELDKLIRQRLKELDRG